MGDTWFEAISNGAFTGWNQIGCSDTNYAVVGVGSAVDSPAPRRPRNCPRTRARVVGPHSDLIAEFPYVGSPHKAA